MELILTGAQIKELAEMAGFEVVAARGHEDDAEECEVSLKIEEQPRYIVTASLAEYPESGEVVL